MNFEVSGRKVYKEPGCQSLDSNWERIESEALAVAEALEKLVDSNWERIERVAPPGRQHSHIR